MDDSDASKLAEDLEKCTIHNFITDNLKKELTSTMEKCLEELQEGEEVIHEKVSKFVQDKLSVLSEQALTPSDLSFILGLMEISTSEVKEKLEEIDPYSVEFDNFFAGDGKTLSSWCPEGLDELEAVCKNVVCCDYRKFLNPSLLLEEETTEPAKKRAHVRKHTDKSTQELKTAQAVTKSVESESKHYTNMTNALKILMKLTEKKKWFPYFRFVVNPSSFVQTLHNIFIVSFLAKEQFVKLGVGKHHELMISPIRSNVNSQNKENTKKDEVEHFVISLSHDDWCLLVDKLDIRESILPASCSMDSEVDKEADYETFANGVEFVD